jgi:poly-gamma-glutamate synthesis protein (capsule biosynthesis protein)
VFPLAQESANSFRWEELGRLGMEATMTDPAEGLTLVLVGDVAPAEPDEARQLELVAPILRAADIAFGQLEEPLSNRGTRQRFSGLGGPRWDRHPMDPARRAATLRDAGFTVMSFAGNHTMDRSEESMFDTIEATAAVDLRLVGAGADLAAARAPVTVEVRGTRVGFLAYCSVTPPGYEAGTGRSGIAPLRARTSYEQTDWQAGTAPKIVTRTFPEDLAAMVEDIDRLRRDVDVVVVSCHWGIHFEPATIAEYQYEAAHAAVDAGADLVIGHHPHILKGIEVYRGAPILYSVNNFCLRPRGDDGEWLNDHNRPSDQQKSVLVRCTIEDRRITRLALTPCWLDIDVRPEPLSLSDWRGESVLAYLRWCCEQQGLDTALRVEDDEIVVGLDGPGTRR